MRVIERASGVQRRCRMPAMIQSIATSGAEALPMSELDRPVWASLQQQPHWAIGDERARRFRPEINRFAATPGEDAECLAALAALVSPGDDLVYLLQVPRIAVAPGLEVVKE